MSGTPASFEATVAESHPTLRGWAISEFVCDAGPGDRPFEENHKAFSVSVVLSGSFNYRSSTGRALLHPGALLLGNQGACYQCGHDHGTGDHCLSVQFDQDFFCEVAATAAGSSQFRFPVAMLPATRDFLPPAVLLQAAGPGLDALERDETLTRFLGGVVRRLSGAPGKVQKVSRLDERRISRALRHLERHAADALDLDGLARVAAMSKYHFLRVFSATTGMTPYQYLLGQRLRRAAGQLLLSDASVSTIAYDSGFGDLSTFNHRFRACFGVSPRVFRANQGRRPTD